MYQFLLGIFAGSAVALLFAPTSGRTVRAKLCDKAIKGQHQIDRIRDYLDKKRRHYANKLLGIQYEMDKFGERAAEKADELKEKLSELADTTKEVGQELKTGMTEKADRLKNKAMEDAEKFAMKATEIKEKFVEKTKPEDFRPAKRDQLAERSRHQQSKQNSEPTSPLIPSQPLPSEPGIS